MDYPRLCAYNAQTLAATCPRKKTLAEPLIVEFPPDTVEVLNELSKELKLDRMEVISRGLGLLQLWLDAHKNKRKIVERPADGGTRNDEYEIDIVR
jgi:hypothetical protein